MKVFTKPNRWDAVDTLKGIGVLAMIVAHCVAYWFFFHNTRYIFPTIRLDDEYSIVMETVVYILLGLVLFLPLCAGIGLRVYVNSILSRDDTKSAWTLHLTIIKRALLLAGVGFAMNYVAWGPDWLWYWNILQFYGLSIVIISLFSTTLSWPGLAVLGIISFLSSIFSEEIQSLSETSYLTAIILGSTDEVHIWPLLPWIYIIIFGYFIGELYLRHNRQFLNRFLLATGSVLTLVSSFLLLFFIEPAQIILTGSGHLDVLRNPPALMFVLFIGLFLLILLLTDYLHRLYNIGRQWFLPKVGQLVTLIYLFHMPTSFWYFVSYGGDKDGNFVFWFGLVLQFILVLFIVYVLYPLFKISSAKKPVVS